MSKNSISARPVPSGEIFADAGRAIAKLWPLLLTVVVAIEVSPYLIASTLSVLTGATFQLTRLWVLLDMAAAAAGETVAVSLALGVLDDTPAGWAPGPARLAAGYASAALLEVILNMATLFSPNLADAGLTTQLIAAARGLWNIVALVVIASLWAIAVPIAIREGLSVPATLFRSMRLLRGARWLSVGFALVYLLALAASQYAVRLTFFALAPSAYYSWLRPAVAIAFSLTATAFQLFLTSFYRRLRLRAEGPSPSELDTIFA